MAVSDHISSPGDGSGTFEAVASEKILDFRAGNIVMSNGDMCSTSPNTGKISIGTYSVQDSVISNDECREIRFSVQGDVMTLGFSYCIKPCGMRLERQ